MVSISMSAIGKYIIHLYLLDFSSALHAFRWYRLISKKFSDFLHFQKNMPYCCSQFYFETVSHNIIFSITPRIVSSIWKCWLKVNSNSSNPVSFHIFKQSLEYWNIVFWGRCLLDRLDITDIDIDRLMPWKILLQFM